MIRTLRSTLVLGFAVFFASAFPSTNAHGQTVTDGSVYSRFGFGELRQSGTSQSIAMGGGGIALRRARYTNFANPASYGDQILTSLGAGITYETVSARDSRDNTGRLSSGTLNFIQFSFPLRVQKVGIGATFAPYSVSRYRVRVGNELITPSTGDTASYTIDYGGSGGLQRTTFGVGVSAHKYLSIGLEGQAVFGTIEESQETNFSDPTFQRSLLSTSTRYVGFNATIGLLSTVPNLFRKNDRLTVGITYGLPLRLNADRIITSGDPQERDTLNSAIDGKFDLPASIAAGVSYQPSAHLIVVADVRYEPWSDFSGTLTLPGYSPTTGSGNLRDRARLSAGAEWIPAGADALASYAARTGYRFGVFYDPSYISPSAASTIEAVGVTGGLSLPTLLPGTRIDLNFEVGKRGTTNDGLVKDLFLKIGLNVNAGERWFLKRRLG